MKAQICHNYLKNMRSLHAKSRDGQVDSDSF